MDADTFVAQKVVADAENEYAGGEPSCGKIRNAGTKTKGAVRIAGPPLA